MQCFPMPETGLSPLARGTPKLRIRLVGHRRFIPAGAGNSFVTFDTESAKSVYPRWRGELCRFSSGTEHSPGLSPLARGTRAKVVLRRLHHRFIPAGAGNSHHRTLPDCIQPVYPRWRGELTRPARQIAADIGLSPLARGTRHQRPDRHRSARFIPAGAGNSLNITYY